MSDNQLKVEDPFAFTNVEEFVGWCFDSLNRANGTLSARLDKVFRAIWETSPPKNTRPSLTEAEGWISVKKRLPEHYGNVLAICKYGIGLAHKTFLEGDYHLKWQYRPENDRSFEDGLGAQYHITHWMPLPKPPNDEAQSQTTT